MTWRNLTALPIFRLNCAVDPASFHTGCPVIKGIKWGAPVWIHIDQFKPDEFVESLAASRRGTVEARMEKGVPLEPGLCQDYDERCAMWAKGGECTKNPGFMVREAATCRKSCGECSPCDSRDWECIHANRKAGGYLELRKEEMEWLGVPWWMTPEPSPEL